jgi:TRAP-type C4-dicarboxylate transport system permease small subunit
VKIFDKILNVLNKVISWVGIIGILALMFLICLDVGKRLLINRPLLGSFELVQLIFCVVVFSSFVYCQNSRDHIMVSIFIRFYPTKLRFIVFFAMSLLVTVMGFIMMYALYSQAIHVHDLHTKTDVLRFETYPFYFIGATLFVPFVLMLLRDTIKAIMALFVKEYAEEFQEKWI